MKIEDTTGSNASRSYEPPISGFNQMPEDHDRETKAIVVKIPRQHEIFKAIEDIDSVDLEPWGWLPNILNPTTKRFGWQRRTAEWIWPVVWCRINSSGRAALFEVNFGVDEYCTAYIPIDSWMNATCDPEAVRAAIQQDYLKRIRGVPYYSTVVKPGMKSLPLHSWAEFKKQPKCRRSKNIPVPSFARYRAPDDVPRTSAWTPVYGMQPHVLYDGRHTVSPNGGGNIGDDPAWGHPQTPHLSYSPKQQCYRTRPPYCSPPPFMTQPYGVFSPVNHAYASERPPLSDRSSQTFGMAGVYSVMYPHSHVSTTTETSREPRERKYSGPPPPLRSEKHSSVFALSYGPNSERGSVEPIDAPQIRKHKRWWHLVVHM